MIHTIQFTGTLVCETGLHIGNNEGVCSPRGLDAPVLQNPVLQQPKTIAPYISATALKGKLRNIAEYLFDTDLQVFRDENEKKENFLYKKQYRHDCLSAQDAADCPVCALFGCVTKAENATQVSDQKKEDSKETEHIIGRLTFRNGTCANPKNKNEFKFENTLKRLVREANPRLNERVVPETEFQFKIVYRKPDTESADKTADNLKNLIACMRFLEDFYLGGNGSRGYGKVKFKDLTIKGESISELASLQKKLSDEAFIQKLNPKTEEAK